MDGFLADYSVADGGDGEDEDDDCHDAADHNSSDGLRTLPGISIVVGRCNYL